MGKPRRKFTPEFKQEAVDLLRRSGKTATQVARVVIELIALIAHGLDKLSAKIFIKGRLNLIGHKRLPQAEQGDR